MMMLWRRLGLLLLASLPCGPVAAQSSGPEAFVASIYALYPVELPHPRSLVIRDHPERYFVPELAEAMRRDWELERNTGTVRALDFDMFTGDQLGQVHNLVIKLTSSGEQRASAVVEFDREDFNHSHARILIDLVHSPDAGWRVFEIRWPGSDAGDWTLRGFFGLGK